jgi:Bacteriocin-protection, YdeI or OmpD-Associated/Domain of unknown function (DUF1905)
VLDGAPHNVAIFTDGTASKSGHDRPHRRRELSRRTTTRETEPMRFRTTLVQTDKTATGFRVPDDAVALLGAGRRPKVLVTINGYTYRNSVAVMGGESWIGVSAEHRAGAGVKGGDELDIDLELDTAPREVTVPADFAAALDAEPAARQTFDSLSYSNRSWHVLSIEGAKSEETRKRRIEKSVAALKEGRPR